MRKLHFLPLLLLFYLFIPDKVLAANAAILGWNNLGMHCMDSRFAEFAILPPYSTIEAQLVINGKLITKTSNPNSDDYQVTYEAVADPNGSFNSSSVNKSDWIIYAPTLFGIPATYTADNGLAHCNMPGIDQPYDPVNGNRPQDMPFQPAGILAPVNTYHAEGIPITPQDDAGNINTYPMMKVVAKQKSSGAVVAESKIVLPVSDEMSCKNCHAANSNPAAKPDRDWDIVAGNPDREYRLNVLKLHDEKAFAADANFYIAALQSVGINSNGLNDGGGLYEQVIDSANPKKPVLCAACHQSEALGTPSFSNGVKTAAPLTAAVHSLHASVSTPGSSQTLNDSENRTACYECHPGSETRCLRGAMGNAVAADGSMDMQCQSCHGDMEKVGDAHRTGWLEEPNCQSCHTGTATHNNGKIRFNSVFNNPATFDSMRVAVDQTFATNPDTPAPGISLYRFSKGHGDLQCSACHGSTHAIFPSSHLNDNVRNIDLQGHEGVTAECQTCHDNAFDGKDNLENNYAGKSGPHKLHPMNQTWAKEHHDFIGSSGGLANCRSCHGSDLRGTELSRVQGDRSFNVEGRTVKFYRGATVGCYSCHNGPNTESWNNAAAPVLTDLTATTQSGTPVVIDLRPEPNKTDIAGLTYRILKQPEHGTVGLNGYTATYYPFDSFSGTDTFLFAGYNGSKNTDTQSKGTVPATATVAVNESACSYSLQPSTLNSVNTGGDFNVGLNTSASCQWQAQSDSGWISVNSANNGNGPATLQYKVDPTNVSTSRTGHITILDASNQQVAQLVVTQEAAPDTDGDGIVDRLDNCTLVANTNQRDTDGDNFGNICDADLNNDNIVNSLDLGLFKKCYLKQAADAQCAHPEHADFNGDTIVNSLDLGLFKKMYLRKPGPSGLINN